MAAGASAGDGLLLELRAASPREHTDGVRRARHSDPTQATRVETVRGPFRGGTRMFALQLAAVSVLKKRLLFVDRLA